MLHDAAQPRHDGKYGPQPVPVSASTSRQDTANQRRERCLYRPFVEAQVFLTVCNSGGEYRRRNLFRH
jgi:hypothetical protein